MTGHASHVPESIKPTAVSRIAAESNTLGCDAAWKRILLAGSCFAMVFGAFACSGSAPQGDPGPTGSGTAGSGTTSNPPGGTGNLGTGGASVGATPLTIDSGR